jgi:spermidine/putrescine transport system permease protein
MSLAAREARLGWGLVAPALAWTVAFFVLPFLGMLALSFARMEGRAVVPALDPGNYARLLTEPQMLGALVNSLQITALVTGLSVLLAYPLAAIIAFRVPRRWQRLALLLAILPFWTSYVVRSYAWLLVLGQNGVLNQALDALGLGAAGAGGDPGGDGDRLRAFLRHAADADDLCQPDAALAELCPRGGRSGRGPLRTFVHVILPLTLPGVMTGAFLTFVLCIGDYITPQILGGNNELTCRS